MKTIEKIEDFNEALKTDKLVLVDFFADWCGPCKVMKPILTELSNENNDILILGVNVDNFPTITEEYKVRSIPTFFYIKNGNVLEKSIGGSTKSSIQTKIDNLK